MKCLQIDFILVPEYDGGMENWGHITVSETLATSGDDAHLIYLVRLFEHEISGKFHSAYNAFDGVSSFQNSGSILKI